MAPRPCDDHAAYDASFHEFLFAVTGASAAWAVLGVCFSLEPAIASQAAHVSGHLFGGVLIATLAMTAAVAQIVTAALPAYKVAVTGNIALGVTTLAAIGAMTTGNPVLIVCVVGLQGIAYGLTFAGSLRHLTADTPPARRGAVMSAFYLIAYGALVVPTVLVGIGGTIWSLQSIFPVFCIVAAALCFVAVAIGLRLKSSR